MAKKELTFTEAFQQLDALAKEFEQQDIDLETSVNYLEKGLELASICKKRLAEVENKVTQIQEKYNEQSI